MKDNICKNCNRTFYDRYTLQRHISNKSCFNELQCVRCKKIFARKQHLNNHLARKNLCKVVAQPKQYPELKAREPNIEEKKIELELECKMFDDMLANSTLKPFEPDGADCKMKKRPDNIVCKQTEVLKTTDNESANLVFDLINQAEQFGNNKIDIIICDENPWFKGNDIAIILGYHDYNQAIRNHVDVDDKKNTKQY